MLDVIMGVSFVVIIAVSLTYLMIRYLSKHTWSDEPEHWTCPRCGMINKATNDKCYGCALDKRAAPYYIRTNKKPAVNSFKHKYKNHMSIELIRNTRASMQDIISLCDIGDSVYIDYNASAELYEAVTNNGTIGYIPSKQSYVLDDCKRYNAEISDISESAGIYAVTIDIDF